ncbi:hypothetical protein JHK82_033420 [Glycine max]|nr:hypothetical protein JHK85_034142 [Glycine max]KAG4985819.1 hypothetical protein JHK86_033510 [Glycine max]KAG5119000.1 hypothetical protein JHK82_033420 [Glycine max]KAG5139994.1 hypothetical protein JHK84_033762 [Glycine max]
MEKPFVSRRYASEGPAVTHSVNNNTMKQKENSSDQYIGGMYSQKILHSLPNMEKYREHFKQPMTMKKEAKESLKLNNDSIVDTGEMKLHRPTRNKKAMDEKIKLKQQQEQFQHAVKLKVDGSFIGNPSLSGFGGLLHDSLVQWLGGFVDSCSHSTNMEAEFQAIHKVIWATKLLNVN